MTLVQRPALMVPGRIRSAPPVLTAVVVAGVLHLLWWQFLATSGGDIAAQDQWAEFARAHPGSAYNLGWYGGMHPVSYSVVSPYIMAAIGVRTSMIVAGTLSAGLLAWLAVGRREGRGRWHVALYGAVALAGNALSGRVTFALGTLFALAALCVVFAWPRQSDSRVERWSRGVLAVLASVLATASSPVAGAFLGLVAVALWVRRRRPAACALGVPPIVVVAVSAALFPFSGRQPMAWYSTILPIAIGVAVVILTPRHWRLVQAGAVLYVLSVVGAWLIPSPVGTNVSRLGLLFGGVVLVAAVAIGPWRTSLIGRRYGARAAAVMLGMALITSTIWQTAYAVRDVVSSAPPESFTSDIDPLLDQLDARDADLSRVEVVPTKSHREAAAIAPHVPLARGWNRQADAERNPVFYRDRDLTPEAYKRWLHRWAVRFVVLSTAAAPDPAAADEADLVAAGQPYLDRLWSDDDWILYEVRHATPLVSPPAKVVAYDAAELTITTPTAGRIVIRIADSPWLSLVDANGDPLPEDDIFEGADPFGLGGSACLTHLASEQPEDATKPPRDDWLVLHAPAPGTYRIAAPYKLPRGTSCPNPDERSCSLQAALPSVRGVLDAARHPTHLGAGRASAVVALALGTAAAWLPFLTLPLSPDEGGFLMVAAQWAPGTSLYGDYWVDRPPLLIGLFQLADLAGGAVALRLLGVLAAVVSVLLAAELGRRLAPGRPTAVVAAAATAAIFLSTPFFGTAEVDGELLAVPFVLGGLVALARGWWAAAGVLAVLAAAVKQSEVDVAVAAVLAAGTLLWHRRPSACLRAVAAFAGGAVATSGVLLWWAAVHGTDPAGLWDAVVTFRGEAAVVISASASGTTDQRAHLVATSFVASGAAGLLLFALFPGRRQHRPVAAGPFDVRLLAAALLVWESVVVIAGGSYWLHYLLATVPGLLVLVIATVRHRPRRSRWLAGVLAYAGAAAVVAVIALAAGVRPTPTDLAVEQYLAAHKAPGDTGVVAFGDPALLEGAGLSSPYPLVWSLPVRVRDAHLAHFTRVLEGPDRPTWVVVDGASLATWGVDDTTARPVLDRTYDLRRVIGDWHVYHLAPEAR